MQRRLMSNAPITLACHVTECNRCLWLKIVFFHIAILSQMQLIVQPYKVDKKKH